MRPTGRHSRDCQADPLTGFLEVGGGCPAGIGDERDATT
jgi:hypothetical protein